MKKCPFCAEQIQDEAIKCRFCGEFLSMAPSPSSRASSEPAAAPQQAAAAVAPREQATPAADAVDADPPGSPMEAAKRSRSEAPAPKAQGQLYQGVPSWRAWAKEYFLICAGLGLIAPFVLRFLGKVFGASTFTHFFLIGIPILIGAGIVGFIELYRRSLKFRISRTTIESESGILIKKIEVLELWRCRDIRYSQDVLDRIMRVATIDIYTADETTPLLQLIGLPASRRLFEELRDSIQIQRQAHNVYAVVE